MNLTSGWLDAITEGADFPQLTDIGGALIVFNNLVLENTIRRFQSPAVRKCRPFPTGLSHRSNWDLPLPKPMDTAPP